MTQPIVPAELAGGIAIVGIAGRFPGASSPAQLWTLLREGREATQWLDDDALRAAGVTDAEMADPNYVRATLPLPGMEMFDAGFFGFSKRDAAVLDPQHRHFLECAWEALEDAGHPPERFDGAIGVFGGCGMQAYLPYNLLTNPQLVQSMGLFLLRHTGNDKDFLTTRVSYLLDLKGPSIGVQTACSTSLVAVHMAAQSLLSGECDMALAGGVTIDLPHRRGYRHEQGEILSPDGHCRAFDDAAAGTLFGSGAGIVALRRVEDALRDGDQIYAVIRGSAVNNDGSGKAGYLAPSVDGQARAAVEALGVAGVEPASVSYIEAHGTGTPVGDPIEVAALTQAYGAAGLAAVGIGSLKTNIGHLDTAAGVASLIKVCLALRHGVVPPTLNFSRPNSQFDLTRMPFQVVSQPRPWPRGGRVRRAAVNSLGVGGTNAHVIVEEAPLQAPSVPATPWQVFALSGRTATSLAGLQRKWQEFLDDPAQAVELSLADVAFTTQEGRRAFAHRTAVVARDAQGLRAALQAATGARAPGGATRHAGVAGKAAAPVVFLLPGGGALFPGAGRELLQYAAFRDAAHECLAGLPAELADEVRALMFERDGADAGALAALERPSRGLPALFTLEIALGRLWQSWGVQPAAVLGHSAGEYAGACLAGMLGIGEAMTMVALRGRLFETTPSGGMLSVDLSEPQLRERLRDLPLDIAAVNAPDLCIVSGGRAPLDAFAQALAADGVEARRLHIDVAAHSRLLEGIVAEFADGIRHIQARPGQARFLSSLSGQWLADDAPPGPAYWSRHLREPVRFADAVRLLLADLPDAVLLEIGPGQGLGSLARQNAAGASRAIVASTGKPGDPDGALPVLLGSAGALWARGVKLDWAAVRGPGRRQRVSLPTYAFDHERHWIEPGRLAAPQDPTVISEPVAPAAARQAQPATLERIASVDDWVRTAQWVTAPAEATTPIGGHWLVVGGGVLGQAFAKALSARGAQVSTVVHGQGFERLSESAWRVDPARSEDFVRLCEALDAAQQLPAQIAHLGALELPALGPAPAAAGLLAPKPGAFDSPVHLAKALQQLDLTQPLQWLQVTAGSQAAAGEQAAAPLQALAVGPVRVIPRELPMVRARLVDIDPCAPRSDNIDALLAEAQAPQVDGADDLVAWRQGLRWRRESAPRDQAPAPLAHGGRLRRGGVYLITGGLGGIALELAGWLARTQQARLALVSRRELPERSRWRAIAQAPDGGADSLLIARLQGLVDAGAQIETFSADVTDRDRMTHVVAQCRERLGPLNGVFHAAGELDDAPLAVKSAAAMSRLLAVKAGGAVVLHELLPPGTLELFAVFSSTSVELGPPGQVDYVAANAAMEALAQSRPDGLAIRWGVWADVGMAARSYGREAPAGALAHPLLGVRSASADGVTFNAVYDPTALWVLDEHRVAGRPVLPGTAYIEIARAAMAQLRPGAAIEARDISFEEAMAFGGGPRQVQTRLLAQGDQYECVVASRAIGETRWQEHARATLCFHEGALLAAAPVGGPWQPGRAPQAACEALSFGPRWNNLERMRLDPRSAVAQLALPQAFESDLVEHGWHPALTDMALTFGLHLLHENQRDGRLYVPVSVDRIRIAGPLPRRLTSRVELRGQPDGTNAVFDATLHGDDGAALATVEGFAMRAIDPAALGRRDTSAARELSLAEALLAAGIRAREAPALFERVFATHAYEVTASSLDLSQVRARMDALRGRGAAGGAHAPRQDGAPAAADQGAMALAGAGPALNAVEEAVAQIWRELLGVDAVGRDDDFFALGGHSLIAVRLFARIRKQLRADLPLSTLFEAPTLAALSAAVAEAAPQPALTAAAAPNPQDRRPDAAAAVATLSPSRPGVAAGHAPAPRHAPAPSHVESSSAHEAPPHAARPAEAGLSAVPAAATPTRRTWSPLVQIGRGEAGRKPLFCVHGAGGNVLNFKLIADRVGKAQPFYGLQAQGVDGRLPPLTSVTAMASQYLEAVLRVQPEGPYRLAGYSAGGLIALEMAQQLRAQGAAVEMLVMIDTLTPAAAKKRVPFARKLWLMRHWTLHFALDWPARRRRGRELDARYAQALEQLARGEPLPPELVDFHLFRNFMDAQSLYEPQPYPGSMALFKARESETQYLQAGPTLGWDRHIGGEIRITPIVGSHFSMMSEPGLSELAQALRHEIERLDAPSAPRPSGRGPGESDGPQGARGWLPMRVG